MRFDYKSDFERSLGLWFDGVTTERAREFVTFNIVTASSPGGCRVTFFRLNTGKQVTRAVRPGGTSWENMGKAAYGRMTVIG